MSKKLAVYFSASGVTGRVAKTLAEAANADVIFVGFSIWWYVALHIINRINPLV